MEWKVDGFEDFLDSGGLTEDIADYLGVATANIPSETFKKETAKYFVRTASKAMNLDTKVLTQSLQELDQAKPEDFVPPQPAAQQDNL